MMECGRIIVYACHSPYKVSSFRSAKLPELHEYLKQSLEEATKDGASAANQKKFSAPGLKGMLPYGKRRSTQVDTRKKSQQPTTGIITAAPATSSTGAQVGGKVAKALEKAEQRRIKRQLRQAEVSFSQMHRFTSLYIYRLIISLFYIFNVTDNDGTSGVHFLGFIYLVYLVKFCRNRQVDSNFFPSGMHYTAVNLTIIIKIPKM